MRSPLAITFPKGFQISKLFGHPTFGNEGKRLLTELKSEHTDRHTHTY